jgi:hypothetical protein
VSSLNTRLSVDHLVIFIWDRMGSPGTLSNFVGRVAGPAEEPEEIADIISSQH